MLERCALKPYYIKNIFEKNQENLKNLSLRLDSVSIDSVLKRGFAWVRNQDMQTIYTIEQAQAAESLDIKLIDGNIKTYPSSEPRKTGVNKEKRIKTKNEKLQIDLFDM